MLPNDLSRQLRSPVVAWGIFGTVSILLQAISRLAPRGLEPLARADLTAAQWGVFAATIGFFAFAEGWRGFHKQFSPRVVARAAELHHAPLYAQILAPLTCMGLVWATRGRLIRAWALTLMIVGLVLAVRGLPYPWRGIVDAGVVVGLSIGVASIAWHLARALQGVSPAVAPEVPQA